MSPLQHAPLHALYQMFLHFAVTAPACAGRWAAAMGRATHALSVLHSRLEEADADSALGAAALRGLGCIRKALSQEHMSRLARCRDMHPLGALLAEGET